MSGLPPCCGQDFSASRESAPHYGTRPELALAAVLQLLSRFPARQSPALARAIVDHLQVIGADQRIAAEVRECASSLVEDWRAYALLSEQPAVEASRVSH
ncbi:MAG: hypothetical protein RBS10_15705 [Thauera propionica]|uniref:Uncharacterized protein n=2 Tax=Thauera TaxID=33057 RepID=A0A235EWT5_9RHOO|nr:MULTISPECIES: hypothetical protein [Thauera]AMO37624.1 hypothetical protein AC731_012140 [Thauera humireducens]ENO74848.1 hypothetical protein C664_18889 [Thauera sp. 63]MDI3488925.1 hypothetical protein [Thauera sp.]MDY0048861.1 hypothetical protein [Thauera propionica]OYD53461.1 hypothetical protein CGK74_12320 [Thauera propionica]